MRSNPNAMPPCGGAPARSPSRRNPKRRLRGGLVDAEQRENPRLQGRIGDADAAAAKLHAVEHHVVGEGAGLLRRGVEWRDVLGVRRRERVVHRLQRAGVRRSRSNSGKSVTHRKRSAAGRDEVEPPGDLLANAVERRARTRVGGGDEQHEVALGEAASRRAAAPAGRNFAGPDPRAYPDVNFSRRSPHAPGGPRNRLELIHLLARQRGAPGHANAAHPPPAAIAALAMPKSASRKVSVASKICEAVARTSGLSLP